MKALRAIKYRHEHARSRLIGALWAISITIAVIAVVFGLMFIAVRMDDTGMSPMLNKGDIVYFSRISKYIRAPKRGDVIASRSDSGTLLLGRIVGLGGESVSVYGGRVYINGMLLDETSYATPFALDGPESYTVPEGCCLVLPDSRAGMLPDPQQMTVSVEDIFGRACLRVSPRLSYFV